VTRLDKAISRLVLAPIAPIALMLAGWWGSFGLLGDSPAIGPAALGGLAAGLVLDLTVLRRRLTSLYDLRLSGLSAVALFYSIGIYGFFMGLPVFNVAVGVAGGWAVGRRIAIHGLEPGRLRRESRRVAGIATGIIVALCVATAAMALNEPTLGAQLRGMFGLPFEVTRPMILAIIAIGGTGLPALQYWSSIAVARKAYGLGNTPV
jgi:hypothetical protein